MANFRTLDGVDVRGKRVLVRVDFNVPMQDGQVTDATRIERACETLEELAGKGAKVVVLSHFGRPKGKPESSMSLAPLVKPLSQGAGRRSTCGSRRTASASWRMPWSTRCRTAGWRCSRTCASTPARRRATRPSPTSSPRWATSTSTTPSRSRTAPTPR